MKRLLSSVVILLLITASCALDPPTYFFDFDELVNNIVKVSFIRYYEQLPRMSQKGETPGIEVDLDMECLEIVYTLDESLRNEFLKDLSDVDFFYPYTYSYGYCDRPYGQGIQLKNDDGSFILFTMDNDVERDKDLRWLAMIDKYDESGCHLSRVADYRSSAFIVLLEKYFGDYLDSKHL
ncbi:MAG: hypothetical protein J6112_10710 [Clostridia bacterium]|nr:hypothetical protein [Clostridia bacterium]